MKQIYGYFDYVHIKSEFGVLQIRTSFALTDKSKAKYVIYLFGATILVCYIDRETDEETQLILSANYTIISGDEESTYQLCKG